MAAWRYEISLLVLKNISTCSLCSLVKYFSTLEEKFRISARPCNLLYLCSCSFFSIAVFLHISCFYFLLVFGPAVIGHSCCSVPHANVVSVCLFFFLLAKLIKKKPYPETQKT